MYRQYRLAQIASAAVFAAMTAGCATHGDFTLKSTDGNLVTLSEQKGKVVLLSFWAVG
jgi:cytochrome oxidase Cu insertion factor (SCO1/SenC/PrrC family)